VGYEDVGGGGIEEEKGGSMTEREVRVAVLFDNREILLDYLKMKIEDEDWHGVQDCASDLRDVDSELKGLDLEETSTNEAE
jgi:hypothetical protein